MLTLKNVTKKYGSTPILQVTDLFIPQGTYWVQGGNGTGKTTLFKIIAGICPFEGSVCLNNIDLKQSPVHYRKEISYAEAEPLFPPSLTGSELILFVQKFKNVSPSQVTTWIDHFNIRHFIDQPTRSYSSGCARRGDPGAAAERSR